MCSRISRGFLISSSRQPHNQNNNNKKFCSDTFDGPDLESKVDRESPRLLRRVPSTFKSFQVSPQSGLQLVLN